ncbi:hypothetical protein [Gimesia sp.]|uniref:hypothetical protein n=1 Tax=Gimesia sp. TaxID=2024833 RepID=UPI003A8E7853
MPSKNDETKTISDDHRKSLIDFFKHQTTLCTATIVLMVTIVGGLFPQPMHSIIIGLLSSSTLLFLGSLGTAFFGLVELNSSYENTKEFKRLTSLIAVSAIAFVLGLLLFVFSFIPMLFIRL